MARVITLTDPFGISSTDSTFPDDLAQTFRFLDYKNATHVLDRHPALRNDLYGMLRCFKLTRGDITAKGGGLSPICKRTNAFMKDRGWQETSVVLPPSNEYPMLETHRIDYTKGAMAAELQWSAKGTSFVRDYSTFRILHKERHIEVAVEITRDTSLNPYFKELVEEGAISDTKYGASDTHFDGACSLLRHAEDCPILVIGITNKVLDKSAAIPYERPYRQNVEIFT